jgi:methionyl-tRNA formyltransferase
MNGNMLKIGALATVDGILSGRIVQAMLERGVAIDAVLVDPATIKARDLRVHEQRTGGRLPVLPLPERPPRFYVSDHNGADCLELVRSLELDLLVNAGTPRIVDTVLLHAAPMGVLNCHPGRLPDYRGACAVEHAVMNDEPVANTLHRMTEGVDEGPVLMIEDVPLNEVTCYRDLRCAVYRHGFDLLASAVLELQQGRLGEADFTAQGDGGWGTPVGDDVIEEIERRLSTGRYTPLIEAVRA